MVFMDLVTLTLLKVNGHQRCSRETIANSRCLAFKAKIKQSDSPCDSIIYTARERFCKNIRQDGAIFYFDLGVLLKYDVQATDVTPFFYCLGHFVLC